VKEYTPNAIGFHSIFPLNTKKIIVANAYAIKIDRYY